MSSDLQTNRVLIVGAGLGGLNGPRCWRPSWRSSMAYSPRSARILGPTSRVNYRPLEKLLLAPPWHRGRVVLIGDAAHATTPHMGYGAGLAIEDAIVLAELLRETAPLAALLDRFVERRYERCRIVVEGSVRLGELEIERASAAVHRKAMNEIGQAILRPI